ncbi:MAG TPA: class I SAM-dependent methyltransferase [Candidatus Thermoplasmatota archaeon]|nr:class I SAM-dependent methyltransferase [Candidatus Thermoplasmatota archaeon]
MTLDPAALREAWEAKYQREPAPWRGPPELGILAPHLAALPPEARVLELGAGGGKTLAAARARDVVALDWARAGLARVGGPRVQASATALPFAPATFDAVLAVHVLGHLPHALRARAADEAVRVLRPGGLLLFADFAEGDMREAKGDAVPGEARTRQRDGGLLYHYFTEEELPGLAPALTLTERELEKKEERFHGVRHERRVLRGTFLKAPV